MTELKQINRDGGSHERIDHSAADCGDRGESQGGIAPYSTMHHDMVGEEDICDGCKYEWEKSLVNRVAAFAESERRAERMECAKAVCAECRRDNPVVNDPYMHHVVVRGDGTCYYPECKAAVIWSLSKGEL